MLNVSAILNDAQSQITDASAETRARMVSWLNTAMQKLAIERDWNFLRVYLPAQTLTSSQLTLPSDFARVESIKGDDWFYDLYKQLTPAEITTADGYTVDSTYITLYPEKTGTADLRYIRTVPTYTDDTNDTIFPEYCQDFLVRAVVTAYYEFDFDERLPAGMNAEAQSLKALKHLDNRLKPQARYFNGRLVNYAS